MNRITQEESVEDFISKIEPQYYHNKNFEILRVFIGMLYSALGDNFQDFFVLDNATGKHLDFLAGIVGVSRNDINFEVSGENLSANDDFFRVFVKFQIAKLFGNGSIHSTDEMMFNLFDGEIYFTTNPLPQALTINAHTPSYYADFVESLYIREFLPLPAGIGLRSIIKPPPTGYRYFSVLNTPYKYVEEGRITQEEYNAQRIRNANYSFPDDKKTIYANYDNVIKVLPYAEKNRITVKDLPEGYRYFSFLSIPYALVTNGLLTEEQYNQIRLDNSAYSFADDDKTVVLSEKDFIYRV